jgi:hypothetical protein
MQPILIDTGLPEFFNNVVIDVLLKKSNWQVSTDHLTHDINELGEYSDSGMLLRTYDRDRTEITNSTPDLRAYADLITKAVLEKQKALTYSKYTVCRYLWNYYNKGSSGVYHRDFESDTSKHNLISIVYYLNHCDGGTEIEGEKYYAQPSHALIFDSRQLHRGFGPYDFKKKMCLNIVLELQ